ncbi:tRNA methyltransferase, has a role in tRNA modification [Tilletia horrida]|nr:tRNA methyltransferase, has a role in tRNA modification [Tilletia horrida]
MGKLSQPTPAGASLHEQDAARYEEENVHAVYEQIASHFSLTRYKPWPLVSSFLSTLPPGSIGADLGCGNGKYLHLRSVLKPAGAPTQDSSPDRSVSAAEEADRSVLTLGLDRSSHLVDIAATNLPANASVSSDSAKRARNEVCVGDALLSGYRSGSMDFAMSIATIHHFASEQRRIEAVLELVRIVKPVSPRSSTSPASPLASSAPSTSTGSGPGRFMIYVWALEQRGESRRNFEGVGKLGEGGQEEEEGEAAAKEREREQDLLVPWVSTSSALGKKQSRQKQQKATNVDNHAGESRQGEEEEQGGAGPQSSAQCPPQVFQRFYHVFKQGELERLVEQAATLLEQRHREQQESAGAARTAGGLRIVLQGSGWERGNWWGVWRVEEAA